MTGNKMRKADKQGHRASVRYWEKLKIRYPEMIETYDLLIKACRESQIIKCRQKHPELIRKILRKGECK